VAAQLFWVWAGLSACSDSLAPALPPSFERPTRVSFVCVNKTQLSSTSGAVVTLEHCQTKPLVVADAGTLVALDAGRARPITHCMPWSLSRVAVKWAQSISRAIV